MWGILINPKDSFSSPTSILLVCQEQWVFYTVWVPWKNTDTLIHWHQRLLVSFVLGGVGGRLGAQTLGEQRGWQVKMECCALSNQLKALHDCFLTNNTCGCWNSSGNLSNTPFHSAVVTPSKLFSFQKNLGSSTCRWLSNLEEICQIYFHWL